MKFGIVSDIHCNVRALEQALRLMGEVDELLCLGDVVTQTRWSDEVVGLLRRLGAKVVLGNHDVEYLKRVACTAVERGQADGELVEWLRSQPERIQFETCGKTLLMVHATPWSWDYIFPGSQQMQRYAEVEADFVLGGHTHAPFAGRIGRAMVINPGSTGQGRFVPPSSSLLGCAVLDVAAEEVSLLDFPEPPLS